MILYGARGPAVIFELEAPTAVQHFHGLFTVTALNSHKRVQSAETQSSINMLFCLYRFRKSNAVITKENQMFSIRNQMLYPVELRAPEKNS
jgi:hypothetical protein